MDIIKKAVGHCDIVTIGIHLQKNGHFEDKKLLKIGWILSCITCFAFQIHFLNGLQKENMLTDRIGMD